MPLDETLCRGAVASRDSRFDGFFITAVLSTGIYCRPSCPARTPKAANMRFYASAAGAQAAGFRACKRCRPDATPGSPDWNVRGDTVARAMRLIADGVVDRDGVPALATSLGYSVRQVERLLQEELGAGPLALAQAQRAQSARTLIEVTDLTMTDIAFAAGFSSVRAFNDVIRATYAMTPSELRAQAARNSATTRQNSTTTRQNSTTTRQDSTTTRQNSTTTRQTEPGMHGRASAGDLATSGTIALRLAYRQPLDPSNLLGHLVATAVPGVEEYRYGAYRATIRLPHGPGIVAVRPPVDGAFPVTLRLADVRDLAAAVSRCRRLLDLDADPVAIDEALGRDSHLSGLVREAPGRRVPRILDPESFALRAVLGQQVSTAAARTHAGRLVAAFGEPIDDPDGGLTHLFPRAADVVKAAEAGALDEVLRLPAVRRRTVLTMATALAEGTVDLGTGSDWRATRESLLALPGIGPWTVETIAMRALGDPDAFLASDLGIRKVARLLGLPEAAGPLEKASLAWSPWRSYAVQYLWAAVPHAVNSLPATSLPAGRPVATVVAPPVAPQPALTATAETSSKASS